MAAITLKPAGLESIEGSLARPTRNQDARVLKFETQGREIEGLWEPLNTQQGLLRTESGIVPCFWCRTDTELHLWVDGNTYYFELTESDEVGVTHRAGGAAAGDVSAPMPGVIRKVLVASGDAVATGTPVAVMESMKMQLSIPAPAAGTVIEVLCEEGQMVDLGDVLLRIGASDPETPEK